MAHDSAVVALVIRLTSEGPVLFAQERVGMNKRLFKLYKFRSMYVDAEKRRRELEHLNEMDGPVFKIKNDPRITPFGRFIRKTSIDELPQLLNVLRGQMSVVGPRPERPVFVEQFRRTVPGYMLRHKVKSGLTGWAQVNGLRGNTSLEKRIQFDLEYIERWSLGLDLKIIVLTVFRVLFDRNAY